MCQYKRRKYSKGGIMLIYDKIKEICKEKGVSVASVEKKAGLSNGAISKWNNASPTVDKLNAVAKILKVKVDKLFE
jgi:transcriptional regulator with XRE-family HTH domain